ncbi:Aste57867_9640 [Aphanomyces stellatus]|uniref:Aste57867_9640 protein n=1 Tax=Aphanomyces stellatus TaxID=120398 RepID=A0A485KNN5_9STRA|nr:hypothetical protein As57867_009602 [Aphanomyces stellatus]VFT86519.1 Aste57867_9640 [Aphanomyces stellatus]
MVDTLVLPPAAAAAKPAADADTTPVVDKARWGKWTPEEEAYTSRLIADFTAGVLTDVENGTTMRSWLSTKLRCCPMRISKKFVGEQSIGKRMFERNDGRINDTSAEDKAKRAVELEKLYTEFCESWAREEREREEHKANGTRKRKRNRSKKGLAKKLPTMHLHKMQPKTTTTMHHTLTEATKVAMPSLKTPKQPPPRSSVISQPASKKPKVEVPGTLGGVAPVKAPAPSTTLLSPADMSDMDIISDLLDDGAWMLPLCDDDLLPLTSKLDSMLSPTSVMDDVIWPLYTNAADVLYDPLFELTTPCY